MYNTTVLFKTKLGRFLMGAYQFLFSRHVMNRIFALRETVEGNFATAIVREMQIQIRVFNPSQTTVGRQGTFVVANHPTGVLDGVVLLHLLEAQGLNVRILAREFLSEVKGLSDYVIPLPFDLTVQNVSKHKKARDLAFEHINSGGSVIAFGSGFVSTWYEGRFQDEPWTMMVAKIACQSPIVQRVRLDVPISRFYRLVSRGPRPIQRFFLLREALLLRRATFRVKYLKPLAGKDLNPENLYLCAQYLREEVA